MSASSAYAYAKYMDTADTEVATEKEPSRKWPEPVEAAAYHGIVGEIVKTIEPISEADSAALLFQTLGAFSCAIGSKPHFNINNGRHPLLDFVVLVGATAKARKGTSWSPIKSIIKAADPSLKMVSGLSSGEGLIERVRDDSEPDEEGKIEHPGVSDKRLLVVEPEFASVLKQVQRPQNILSAIVRDAWDGNTLETLTRRNNALKATDPHITILGHITRDELHRSQAEGEWHNGFGNRFLWCSAKRSKNLPEGASLDSGEFQELVMKAGQAITVAGSLGELQKSPDTVKYWAGVYPGLSEGSTGLFGDMTARSEAHALRLGYLYAVLDGNDRMYNEHLTAALAVWKYAEASARYLFGDRSGDPLADEIMGLLKKAGCEGLTRTEIYNQFGRHKSSERIGAAMTMLEDQGKVTRTTEKTAGRDVHRWRVTQ